MDERDLLTATGDAYCSLIHLREAVDESLAKISVCARRVSDSLIDQLLQNGDSWRERLLGLVFGAMRGIDQFYDSLLVSLHRTGTISIVPNFAALAVAVRDCGCRYDRQMTALLDRDRWDGEIGFALDWFHYSIGIGDIPRESRGPNYGQDYTRHLIFYANLNAASTTR